MANPRPPGFRHARRQVHGGLSWKVLHGFALALGIGLLAGCGPSLKSSSADDRIRALKGVTDQTVLAQFAREDVDRDVRLAAIAQLSDQNLLGQVVLAEQNERLASQVLDKITDQGVLTNLALAPAASREDADALAHAAVLKITDQAGLARIVLGSTDARLRGLAMSRLTDQALLAKVAFESTDGVITQLATEKITDQAVLAKIAGDKNSLARNEAVGHLTDQALLLQFALHDDESGVRATATSKLTDQAVLGNLALEDKDPDVRLAAAGRLTDRASLLKVALNDQEQNKDVRCIAMDTLARLGDKSAAGPLSTALPDLGVNGALGSALEKLGWQPASANERVYFWVCQQDITKMKAHWEETKRVLLNDLRSGDYRKSESAVYSLVSLGNQEVTPELIRFLNESSNQTTAEMFLNCGNPELHQAAADWAKRNGYQTLQTNLGGVTAHTAWGNWHTP